MKRAGWAIVCDEEHMILAAALSEEEGAAWERAYLDHLTAGGTDAIWWDLKEGLTAEPCTEAVLHEWARDGIDTAWTRFDGIVCTQEEREEAERDPEAGPSEEDRETWGDEKAHYRMERDL